jgi:type IV secretory pathway VirD2 relaxase
MADNRDDSFHIKPGRPKSRGGRANLHSKPFLTQVKIAVRKAGGNPDRIGGSSGQGSGRFNARGRGAKLAPSFPKDGGGWTRDGSGTRFRSRRVVIKASVVKLAPQRGQSRGSKFRGTTGKAVDAHLRYLERDGVTKDGEKGRVYSAIEDEADGKAFVERGRDDRHQFRFIVAPEDAADMADMRSFTRDLMKQVESDLDTMLDWIAVDHHNTGHPHTHVIVRGVLDDGRILNIAGDYIAHGVRHRAQELVTLELGQQSELDVAEKLRHEVEAERLTRLDKMLIAESHEHGIIDLRPDASDSYTVQANRHFLIDRAKRLEKYGLADEIDTGRWTIRDDAEQTLRALGERGDIIKTMHRALQDHDLAEERGARDYITHGKGITEPVVGRVLAKGLAGDEMSDRLHLVVDGVDGHTHYVETADIHRLDDIQRGHIVSLDPIPSKTEPRASDLNIRDVAANNPDGIYRPSEHLEQARAKIEKIGGDPDAFIRSHVRRLEALRRAGHVERINADHWKIPHNLPERGMAYDARDGAKDFTVRTLSTLNLNQQVGSDGATWLDRELASRDRTPLSQAGFGREVSEALDRRRHSLVDQGHAVRRDNGGIQAPKDLLDRLERTEIDRVGRQMAAERGMPYTPSQPGEYVSGTLKGSVNLASGRFAMMEDGLGFQLVPWQPALDQRIGQHISGVAKDGGGIDWSFARKRGLGL